MFLRGLCIKLFRPRNARLQCNGNIDNQALETELLGQYNDCLVAPSSKRILKVAILGAPNAGKSTLINKLVGHPVLCVSKKVHTTRHRERAAIVRDNAQILFVDTPGLVSLSQIKKYHLEDEFRRDGNRATDEADIVGVIHDAANVFTRGRLDNNLLHILNVMGRKPAFLVLNKVDAVKSKGELLSLIKQLTGPENPDRSEPVPEEKCLENGNCTGTRTEDVKAKMRIPRSWNHFAEVFLVSALKGDGVSDLLDYLLKEAEEGKWVLPPGQITERTPPMVLQELVRGRLLDSLPQEVPYNLVIETEYYHVNELGEVVAVLLVTCPLIRHCKMLVGGNGRRVKEVATLAEADARDVLQTHVRLRIVVTSKEEQKQKTALSRFTFQKYK